MKKILLTILLSVSIALFSQGKINVFNYSSYNLFNSLVGSDANSNCFPSITGNNHPIPVPPLGAVTYSGYYQSGFQSPPILTWMIYTAGGGVSSQVHSNPILANPIFALNTSWQLNKFFVEDINGNVVPYGGNSIGTLGCNTPLIDYVGPSPGNPIPYEAFWFVASGETFFIIQ